MPNRKHPARGVFQIEGRPTVVFDTVCTKGKLPWLANDVMHTALLTVWREQATAWAVGRYVVMPNHIHYFAWATASEIPFANWVKFWKSKFA